MSAPRKVRITHLVLIERVLPGTSEKRSHVAIVDTKGRAWERTSDMPLGVWGQIDLPDEPDVRKKK